MERACQAFVQWFSEEFDPTKVVGIICGTGNNGGDGLGIARLLDGLGYSIKLWIVKGAVAETGDFKTNRERLPSKLECKEITSSPERGVFAGCNILIDGIFGSGLSRPLDSIYAEVVTIINETPAKVVSIDVPSGLFADRHTSGIAVWANYTVTFQTPKLAFLFPENEDKIGEWLAVDIGLSKTYLKGANASYFLIEKKFVRSKIPIRKKFAHKGDFGKALLIAGSFGKMGACVLAAKAAMKSGVGLLTVHVPKIGYQIIQTTVPEAMASIDLHEKYFTTIQDIDYTAIGIGPGLGLAKETVDALKKCLELVSRPLVIDADGINILALNSSLLHLLPENSILTPHPGELHRLIGEWENEFQRLENAKVFAAKTKCILVIKGANSAIVAPDGRVFFNSTGNPGMATAGSGDVLTGILTGLLAQKIEPLDVAIIGVFVHGFAGDLAALDKGYISLTSPDILDSIPLAFKQLSR